MRPVVFMLVLQIPHTAGVCVLWCLVQSKDKAAQGAEAVRDAAAAAGQKVCGTGCTQQEESYITIAKSRVHKYCY